MTATQKTPFARAIELFLSEVKSKEDVKSRFYREVLLEASELWNQDFTPDQRRKSADSLLNYVAALQKNQKSQSKTLWVADKLKPLVSGLNQYTSALDVMVQAFPAAVMILYGGAKLVLQLAQGFADCFDTIMEIMDDIGHLLQCYELFTRAYQSSTEMMDLLVGAYKSIILFWRESSRVLTRKPLKTLLIVFIEPLSKEWENRRQNLQRYCTRVQQLAQATEANIRDQKEQEQSNEKTLERRKRVIEWIKGGEADSKVDVRIDFRRNLELQHAGTCQWLYDEPKFKQWKSANTTSAVWYHAGPGSGKTVLCSSLIKTLKDESQHVAWFFFSFNDPTKSKVLTALRSLILQLITQLSDVPPTVFQIYEIEIAHHVNTLQDHRTAIAVFQALLKEMKRRTHIVLDGLDECSDPTLMKECLGAMVKTKHYGIVKWFFASRNDPAARAIGGEAGASEIVAPRDQIQADIKHYIETYLKKCYRCIDEWTERSDGNFLWSRLMMQVLEGEGLTCDEEIQEELEKFPKDLTGWYLRSLQQLSARSAQQQELARKIFWLLVTAKQPLRLSEMRNALGVRIDAEDYSPGRIPKEGLVEELCGPLVDFDRRSEESEHDPVLRLSHKSVQDFFLQDPASLGVTDTLAKYFIHEQAASLEVSRLCLTYLTYARYHRDLDIANILRDDPNNEHAFLRYAATFWFWHLMRVEHPETLFQPVESFLRSPAFWTCLAVQTRVSPHLFARLTEHHPRCYAMSSADTRKPVQVSRVNFAVPLPDWLGEKDDYPGQEIVKGFLAYIKEWHPVLTSYPDAVKDCTPGVVGHIGFPFRKQSSSDSIQALQIRFSTKLESNLTLHLNRTRESNFTLFWASDLHAPSGGNKLAMESSQFASAGKAKLKKLGKPTQMQLEMHGWDPRDTNRSCHVSIVPSKDELTVWLLNTSNLDLLRPGDPSKEVRYKSTLNQKDSESVPWSVHATSFGPSRLPSVAFHCATEDACFEDDGSSDRFDSDKDSVFNSDSETESDDEGNDKTYAQHCLIIAQSVGRPLWFPWQAEAKKQLKIACAFHPKEPTAVWSHAVHEICTADLQSGTIIKGILPEPVDVQFGVSGAMCKELRFSTCGKFLYYLLCSFSSDELGSTCSVYLTTWHFDSSATTTSERLRRACPIQNISYKLADDVRSFSAPLVLTDWSDEYLLVALPPLHCAPRVIRIGLQRDADAPLATPNAFETLSSQIFVPSSTPYRKPQILLLRQQPETADPTIPPTEHMVLCLDHNGDVSASKNQLNSPALVMTWSLAGRGGWRPWDPAQDECSEQLKKARDTFKMLRGSYVDASQRFNVLIRSGLDWTKKAFLTCS